MLAPHPSRLRSNSSPIRPQGGHPESTLSSEIQPASSTSPQKPSELPRTRSGSISFFAAPSQSSGGIRKSKLFRLKRPSSSSAALQPNYRSDLVAEPPSTTPPRPPRNPARATPVARPSSSSGVPSAQRKLQRVRSLSTTSHSRESSPHRGFGPILESGSDFVLQRKKSRTSKVKLPQNISRVQESPAEIQFSTTDRTILEELKRKMEARDAQFVVKNGKRHHPHPSSEVPYPRSHERHIVDNDIWECKWSQQTCGGMTWHIFEEPPQKVLDIGCGAGTWILDCAMQWKDTHFVGLDIVPLQADLQQVGSSQLASRITWVQANFLEGLPFPNEEFDFIHVTRIARGVPEDKWDILLEEITRVMKPGATFELFEEELSFPGKPLNSKAQEPGELPTSSSSPSSSSSVLELHTHSSSSSSAISLSSPPVARPAKFDRPRVHTFSGSMLSLGAGLSIQPPVVQTSPRPRPRPVSAQPQQLSKPPEPITKPPGLELGLRKSEQHDQEEEKPKSATNPRDHSLLEYIYNEMHASRFINLEPLALLMNSLSLYFTDVRTHPPLILTFPPLPAMDRPKTHKSHDSQGSQDHVISSEGGSRAGLIPHNSMGTVHVVSDANSSSNTTTAVSISLAQLIKGSHRYVMLDDNRATALSPSTRSYSGAPHKERTRAPSMSGSNLFMHPYPPSNSSSVTLTSISDQLSDADTIVSEFPKQPRIPDSRISFDVRTLNMHLALRTQEILACAETMWDFVLDYRINLLQREAHRPSVNSKARLHDEAIKNMTRKEFDLLMTWFELDMQDSICLSNAVHERLGWDPFPLPKTERRKDFLQSCAEWAIQQNGAGEHHRKDCASEPASPRVVPSDLSVEEQTPTKDPEGETPVRASGPPKVCPVISPPPEERISRILRVFVAWKT